MHLFNENLRNKKKKNEKNIGKMYSTSTQKQSNWLRWNEFVWIESNLNVSFFRMQIISILLQKNKIIKICSSVAFVNENKLFFFF